MNKLIVYFIILLDLSFFYVLPIREISSGMIGNYQKIGVVIYILIINFLFAKSIFSKDKKYVFGYEIILFMIIYLFRLIISYFIYNQSIVSVVSISNEYIVLLAYFIICLYLSKKYELISIENMFIKSSIILAILMILQYVIYNLTNKLFLFIDREILVNSMRYNSIRIYENDYFFVFVTVLSFGMIIKDTISLRNKKIILVSFILSFFQVLMISKSRMGLVMVVLSCTYMILQKYKHKKLNQVFMLLISIISIISLLKVPIIKQAITSISLKDDSLRTRISAIDFYYNQLEENPIIGVGFIKPIIGDESYNFVMGKEGKFYKSDMGIFGSVHTFGIIFIVWYLLITIKIYRVLRIISRNRMEGKFIEIYGIFFLSVIGGIVMNPFDPQRIVIYPFILALVDYSYKIAIIDKREFIKIKGE